MILFGSKARGDSRSGSDWDFLILISQKVDEKLKRAKEGLTEMTNPDKPTIETQKYRLTEKGKKLQKRLLEELT